jgi:RNA polymerase sigma-70 factor (ECF subfamily)
MDPRDDVALLEAAGRGNREAFAVLVERHHRAVIHFIHRFLGTPDRDTVEDLAQEVFLAAWQGAAAFRPRAKVLTWLLRIATNDCLNYRRGQRLRTTISLDARRHAERPGPADHEPQPQVLTRERAAAVHAAIASLPPMQRAAVLLHHFHHLPYKEIAGALETTLPAVESLLFRAKRSLAARLACEEKDTLPQVLPHIGAERG